MAYSRVACKKAPGMVFPATGIDKLFRRHYLIRISENRPVQSIGIRSIPALRLVSLEHNLPQPRD